jgi:uncharacterized protein (TIGR04222 family)
MHRKDGGNVMSLGPFDWSGGPFLMLYVGLLIATIVASIVIPVLGRPDGRHRQVTEIEQLAYLAGQVPRFAEAIVIRLLAGGALRLGEKGRFQVLRPPGARTGAEAGVLALSSPIAWSAIEHRLRREAEPIGRGLVAAGLMMDDETAERMRVRQTLPYLALMIFGSIKLVIGDLRDRPVGILTGLLVATAILAVIRWVKLDRRTEAGHAALATARRQAERLKRAPTTGEIDQAVALFGTAVLVGSGWAAFHSLRSPTSGDGGGGGDGDGGGGGGCGGCS